MSKVGWVVGAKTPVPGNGIIGPGRRRKVAPGGLDRTWRGPVTTRFSREIKAVRVARPAPAWTHTFRLALLLVLALYASLAGSSCRGAGESPLAVAAAADLQSAFAEIGATYERDTGGKVTFVFGASGTLATQIENGAPFDVFASASDEHVAALASRGATVAGSERVYALGTLALVSFAGGSAPVARIEDLARPEVRRVAIANPEHAPYGAAAREALVRAGIWEQVAAKVVYGENVRQALQFVQTGNAEAGIVAAGIANVPEVRASAVPEGLYHPLRQTLALIKGTPREARAAEFSDLVTGPKGREILRAHGYALPAEGEGG